MQETITPENTTPETDKDDDYVFDVYYRDKADVRNNTQIMSNIGLLLVILSTYQLFLTHSRTGFYDEFGLNFDQDYSSDSTDIQDEADEDSNGELSFFIFAS